MHDFDRTEDNLLKCSGVRRLHFEAFSAIEVKPTFLISDIQALWRSVPVKTINLRCKQGGIQGMKRLARSTIFRYMHDLLHFPH